MSETDVAVTSSNAIVSDSKRLLALTTAIEWQTDGLMWPTIANERVSRGLGCETEPALCETKRVIGVTTAIGSERGRPVHVSVRIVGCWILAVPTSTRMADPDRGRRRSTHRSVE